MLVDAVYVCVYQILLINIELMALDCTSEEVISSRDDLNLIFSIRSTWTTVLQPRGTFVLGTPESQLTCSCCLGKSKSGGGTQRSGSRSRAVYKRRGGRIWRRDSWQSWSTGASGRDSWQSWSTGADGEIPERAGVQKLKERFLTELEYSSWRRFLRSEVKKLLPPQGGVWRLR